MHLERNLLCQDEHLVWNFIHKGKYIRRFFSSFYGFFLLWWSHEVVNRIKKLEHNTQSLNYSKTITVSAATLIFSWIRLNNNKGSFEHLQLDEHNAEANAKLL